MKESTANVILAIAYVICGAILGSVYCWTAGWDTIAFVIATVISPAVTFVFVLTFISSRIIFLLGCVYILLPQVCRALSEVLNRSGHKSASLFVFEHRYHSLWATIVLVVLVVVAWAYTIESCRQWRHIRRRRMRATRLHT